MFDDKINKIIFDYYKSIFNKLILDHHNNNENSIELNYIISNIIPLAIQQKCIDLNIIYYHSFNKYSNIYPLPSNIISVPLVILINDKMTINHYYFNASIIKDHQNIPRFIASQAPLNNNMGLFYAMLYRNDICNIIMCTNYEEDGFSKCAYYLPSHCDEEFEYYTFLNCSDEDFNKIQYEKFYVTKKYINTINKVVHFEIKITSNYSSKIKIINHFHITNWKDGKAITIDEFNEFYNYYIQYAPKKLGILDLIHCSAGVGRTGVIIVALFKKLYHDPRSIDEIIIDLRKQRTMMIHSQEQYDYLQKNF
jgi:protein tyrosine phosphatase